MSKQPETIRTKKLGHIVPPQELKDFYGEEYFEKRNLRVVVERKAIDHDAKVRPGHINN